MKNTFSMISLVLVLIAFSCQQPEPSSEWISADKPPENLNDTSNGLSLEGFNKLVKSEKMVLVDYHATWCEPCNRMDPIVDAVAEKLKNKLTLIKIDIDENVHLFNEKKIHAIPLFELYKNGKLIWKYEGEVDEETLIEQTK